MKKKFGAILVDVIMYTLIFLTVALGILSIFWPETVKSFLSWVESSINSFGNFNYLIVFLSGLIEGFPILGIVVPGQNILLIVGGFFAKISNTNLIYVMIIASIGAMISNYIGYKLGVHYGDSFFKKYGAYFGIGLTEVKYLKVAIKKWGPVGIILGKFHNVARAFVPFIAGSMGMKNKVFYFYNVIGSIIRAVTIIVLGVLFAEYYETIIDYFTYILLGLMVLTAIYIYKFKKKEFLKYLEEKNAEIDAMTNSSKNK